MKVAFDRGDHISNLVCCLHLHRSAARTGSRDMLVLALVPPRVPVSPILVAVSWRNDLYW